MVMFLMALSLSVFGLAMSALAFGAATRNQRSRRRHSSRSSSSRPSGSSARAIRRSTAQPNVPLEVLLFQIERHVRLEQAAAESFIHLPSPEALNLRTQSPLAH